MGDRADLMVRVPRDLVELFTSDAAAAGVSQSVYMEEILRERYADQISRAASRRRQGGVVRKKSA